MKYQSLSRFVGDSFRNIRHTYLVIIVVILLLFFSIYSVLTIKSLQHSSQIFLSSAIKQALYRGGIIRLQSELNDFYFALNQYNLISTRLDVFTDNILIAKIGNINDGFFVIHMNNIFIADEMGHTFHAEYYFILDFLVLYFAFMILILVFFIIIISQILIRKNMKNLHVATSFLSELTDKMSHISLNDLPPLQNSESMTQILEFEILDKKFVELIQNLRDQTTKIDQLSQQIGRIEISKQVAHDIRSPLTALNMMLGSMTQLPEQQRVIMRSAITRINDIANDLLNKGKQIHQDKTSPIVASTDIQNSEKLHLSSQLLSPIVDTIASEKRIQFREKQNIEIISDIDKGYGLFAEINAIELKRVISNLLNNAIEAMPEEKGRITVGIRGDDHLASIIIQDNGKGIPQHIIEKLGQLGVSHGKEGTQSGSGIGIYHAKKTTESFGGKFVIESSEGVGTTISLIFPKTPSPKWFVEKLTLKPKQLVISLDDDLSIHGIWKGRFASKKLNESGVEHLTFTSGEEFKQWLTNNKAFNTDRLYLVDYELLNQKQTGLEIIEDLGIGSRAILVSSRYEENKIREKCEQLEVKLIPKAMACLVPIEIEKPKEKYDLCLLDDDFLVEASWKMYLDGKNKRMFYASNPDDFLKKAPDLELETPIYVDSNLGNGIKGEDIAKKLYEMGFKNIWLCTGYQASDFPPMPWIKGVIGKEPPL